MSNYREVYFEYNIEALFLNNLDGSEPVIVYFLTLLRHYILTKYYLSRYWRNNSLIFENTHSSYIKQRESVSEGFVQAGLPSMQTSMLLSM